MMSAPRYAAIATAPSVGSRRSCGSRPSAAPVNRFRDGPQRRRCGARRSRSSAVAARSERLSSAVLPKPRPGSTTIRSRATPAPAAASTRRRSSPHTTSTMSPPRSGRGRVQPLSMTTSHAPCRAVTSARRASRRPDASFTTRAPARSAASATAGFDVSIETGTSTSRTRRPIAGSTRASSTSSATGVEPGRVDSPPRSRMAAPSATCCRPRATIASVSRSRPSPLKESGVAFRMPMIHGRAPDAITPASLAREREALKWLFSFSDMERGAGWSADADAAEEWKLGRTRALLDLAAAPDRRMRCVLIAGTKGKGSTAAFLAALLHAGGVRAGLYTQPHVQSYRERIRVDGAMIEPQAFASAVDRWRGTVDAFTARHPKAGRPTTFEITTALALAHFAEAGCTVAVLEVGLGGRLDATNAVEPELSVLSTIDRGHTDILGTRLE